MTDVAKLKKKAAEYELKKQFDKALATYVEILDRYGKRSNEEVDLALYNRVGDLFLKQGNVADALDYYEQAVDRYAEGGFFNNAIALCNKILRNSPGRASVYYKLGKISAHKGFKGDAKANFLEYADRMQRAGNIDESFRALKEFADLAPDQDDIRLMLADQLLKKGRGGEAVEQLQTLYQHYLGEGRDAEANATLERIKAIDPKSGGGAAAPAAPRAAPSAAPRAPGDLVFLDLDDAAPTPARSAPAQPRAAAPPPAPAAPPERPAPRPSGVVPQQPSPAQRTTAQRATAGLDIISTGEEPASRPIAPAPAPRAATPPIANESIGLESPAAMQPELDREESIELEMYEPEPMDDLSREVDLDVGNADAGGSLLDGLETNSFGAASDPESGGLLDFEPTSLGEAPPRPPRPSRPAPEPSIADGLIDFEMPDQRTKGPREIARPSLHDLPMLEEDPVAFGGGELDLVMPEEEEASEPLADIPLMDLDLPSAGEATASITGSYATQPPAAPEPDLELLDLSSPAFTVEPEPVAEMAPAELDVRANVEMPDDYTAVEAPAASGAWDTVPGPVEESGEFDAIPAAPRRSSTMLAAQSVEMLQALVEADPDDCGLHRRLGEAMLESGDREGGLRELEAAMVGYERSDDLASAASLADEIVLLNPGSVRHHQKRVEYAFRTNERGRLIEAYLQLADALFRAEQVEKSRAIYQRVLDLSPDDLRANAALQSFPEPEPAPVAPPPPPPKGRASTTVQRPVAPSKPLVVADDEFVNLGDWLRDDEGPKDTRMVVEEKEPTGDEEADFQDMLRKFKQGIAENVEEEDHQSHYDLGVAYKEMGLLDEAIAEFQKALRGPANRVSTYEALGQCFIEKEQYPVAATILQRALHEQMSDDQLVGVLYLLGVCAEVRGQLQQAADFYQRVFVVDIQFRDVGDRLATVESAL